MTLTEHMLAENAAVFDAMVRHRFVSDVVADRLPAAVFDRYLVYEGAFVETAIRIFAFGVAKAPAISDQRWLIGVLDALANTQVAYFEKTAQSRGIDQANFQVDEPAVVAFCKGMLAIARDGTFYEIITAMFAAEWMYWTWSRGAARGSITDPDLRRWVDLHAADDFAAQALWLRARLDAADDLDAVHRARLSMVFGEVQRLEIAFHAAAYRD